ncbi:hypothetical protein HWD32_gp72 [Gordonia phage Secretariat]|uniref:Uncharacterized protein n=1 Tax=Gordonia phage Secretariat TaxID=2725616 RepID=A0A6M3SVB1_9CAUD|nr:hypothetical protein HWD32_gp72 [Gordonia phage Secretariat]QJD49647.1 hypothetical protein SEA_SECRETARIAT_72 [Gordonia phage Secretariat]
MSYTTETPVENSFPKPAAPSRSNAIEGLEIQTFQRKPFQVEAVQITEENFEKVAAWCGGSIVTVQETRHQALLPGKPKRFIQVNVTRPLSKRQTEAYVGDWILFASKGYKVYANRPFLKNFESIPEELFVTAEAAFGDDDVAHAPVVDHG